MISQPGGFYEVWRWPACAHKIMGKPPADPPKVKAKP
jgi:hypothetical protein